MAQIGTFNRGEDGSYTGTIRTLSLNIKVRFVPAEPSQNEKAPDLRVLAGNNVDYAELSRSVQLGSGRRKRTPCITR